MRPFWRNAFIGWLLVMGVWGAAAQMWERNVGTAGECKIGYVYDGDTVELKCRARDETARLVGFDTPETKDPGCEAERALGEQAKLRLRGLVASGEAFYRRLGHDRYGRELIRLKIDGIDVGDTLIGEGLAVAYTGGSRINWCVRLGEQ